MKKTFLLILLLLTFGMATCNAATISYSATDLTDVTAGEDLWEYTYRVTDYTFAGDTGFTIYFDLGRYEHLDPIPPSPNADWDIASWEPDPALPDDGAYDAYALTDNASLADIFSIRFVWLGGGAGPESQFFEIYDGLSLTVLDSGFTTPATVPLPATLWLFGSALVLLRNWKKD